MFFSYIMWIIKSIIIHEFLEIGEEKRVGETCIAALLTAMQVEDRAGAFPTQGMGTREPRRSMGTKQIILLI